MSSLKVSELVAGAVYEDSSSLRPRLRPRLRLESTNYTTAGWYKSNVVSVVTTMNYVLIPTLVRST